MQPVITYNINQIKAAKIQPDLTFNSYRESYIYHTEIAMNRVLHKIEPARSRDQDVAAPLQLTGLVEDAGASVGHNALDHRALGKLPRLVVDLDRQLPDNKHNSSG